MLELQRSVTKRSLLVVVVMVSGLGNVLGDLQAYHGSQFCSQHPTFLSCNFLGTQELVVLESLAHRGGQAVSTVFIHNAANLLVANDVCVSLVASSVANITYDGIPEDCNPEQQFTFKLADSSVNLVPPYINQLDLQRSTAKEVVIDRDLRSFSVVSSDIGHLKVSKPVTALNIKIEHSTIDNFEKLHLESKSQLVLYSVTIKKMSKSSLYLEESSLSIWTGNIKDSLEQAIILGPRASLSLKDTDGKVSLSGVQELPSVPTAVPITQQEHRPPGVPPSGSVPKRKVHPCNQSSVILWVFPTVLAAAEAIIIIVNCTNWFPAFKGRRVPRGLEEGGQSVTRQTRPQGYSSDSTWYCNNEVSPMAVNRRQNTVYDKYK